MGKKVKLEKKHKIEKEFHDRWAKEIKPSQVNYKGAFTEDTAVENRFILDNMERDLKDKKILDLGCGMGDATLFFASKGARVYPVDISPGMVHLVKKLSKKYGLDKQITAAVMVAENLKFPKGFFDYVYGNGVLHHTVPSLSLEEIYKVLKPGGKAFFVEPLGHNPVINIYRKVADKVRTPTEKPLNYKQLNNLTIAKFSEINHTEFHLFTLLIFVWFYFFERVHPNKQRYWKKIIDEGKRIAFPFLILHSWDRFIVKYVPFLKKYFWNTVIVYKK